MPGVPGRSGGANRKRSDQKLGNATHAKDHPDHPSNVDTPEAEPVVQPTLVFPTGEQPHAMVQRLWDAMAKSGFHEFYTQADWEAAAIAVFNLQQMVSEMIAKGSLPANKSAEMRSIFQELLVTESARRRLKIEVQRHRDTPEPQATGAPLDRANLYGVA